MALPSTGHAQIDSGHDRLVLLLEKLRYNPADPVPVFVELAARLQGHFREEEELMRGAGYRRAKAHATEHRALSELLLHRLPREMEAAADYPDLLGAVDRARQSFLDHVLGLDHELALYLVGRERRARAKRPRGKAR